MAAKQKKVRWRWKDGARIVQVGHRHVISKGLAGHFWTDLYYAAMTVSWPGFFAAAALAFVTLNTFFALLYSLGHAPIANAPTGSFLDLLFFSIETLATVGYGDMHPQTIYGHAIATLEIFTGTSCIAVLTGMVFARFSRPRPRFIFARHPVIGPMNGQPSLLLRMANARHNEISNARAKMWLVRSERTQEGIRFRRFYRMNLVQDENPLFILTWTLVHPIDEKSPLYGLSAAELEKVDANIIITVSGLDENAAQEVHKRKIYSFAELRWNHQYASMVEDMEDGFTHVDYRYFHLVEPLGVSEIPEKKRA